MAGANSRADFEFQRADGVLRVLLVEVRLDIRPDPPRTLLSRSLNDSGTFVEASCTAASRAA